MNEALFNIILALIPVFGAIITGVLVPYIKNSIDLKQLEKYEKWATQAVKCAEMLWTETGHGADKKQYVVDFLNNTFNSKKTVITEEQLNVLIESAVKELKIEQK